MMFTVHANKKEYGPFAYYEAALHLQEIDGKKKNFTSQVRTVMRFVYDTHGMV